MSAQNVIVCARCRPPNKREIDLGSPNVILMGQDKQSVKVHLPGSNAPAFSFDRVFDIGVTQEEVFAYTAQPLVKEVFNGFNTTIFAYGQTGSGKTFSMMGLPADPKLKGIIPRLTEAIFQGVEEADEAIEFTIKISYIEIYNEKLRDLLEPDKDNLKIREGAHGVWIEDITEIYVNSIEQVLEVMQQGQDNRAIAATNMNMESSRSHSVFMMTLGQRNTKTGSKKGAKLVLVDLAGSEKVEKTGAAGQTLKEAQHINKSLSALGNVINALTTGGRHIPYRDSKLTRLLTDSLGGNSKTCLVITLSPAADNAEESLSTLRFGTRAKSIKNKPVANQEKSVEEYKRELAQAYAKIAAQELLIKALEKDVTDLRTCLSGVDPKNLKTPIPNIPKRNLADFQSKTAEAEAAAVEEVYDDDDDDQDSNLEEKEEKSVPSTPLSLQTQSSQSGSSMTSPGGQLAKSTPIDSKHSDSGAQTPVKSPTGTGNLQSPLAVSPTPSLGGQGVHSPSIFPATPLVSFGASGATSVMPQGGSSSSNRGSGTGAGAGAGADGGVSPSPDQQVVRELTERTEMLLAENTVKLRRIEELDLQNKDFKNQLQRSVQTHEQQRESFEKQLKKLQATLSDLTAKKDEFEAKAVQAQEVSTELDLLKRKIAMLEKEHTLQMSQAQDDNKELQAKLQVMLESAEQRAERKKVRDAQRAQQATTGAGSTATPSTPGQGGDKPGTTTPTVTVATPEPKAGGAEGKGTTPMQSPRASVALKESPLGQQPQQPMSVRTGSSLEAWLATSPVKSDVAGFAPSNADLGLTFNPDMTEAETLRLALQKKCDQYLKLQIAHQNRKEHLLIVEAALEAANKKLKENAIAPRQKIKQLEEKLGQAEMLCKKLLESGLYWRQQRKQQATLLQQRIVVPLHGGKRGRAGSGAEKGLPGSPATGGSAAKTPRAPAEKPSKISANSMDRFF